MSNEDGLLELREQLDSIDNKILDLLNDRMKLVHKVGALKAKSGGAIGQIEKKQLLTDLKK